MTDSRAKVAPIRARRACPECSRPSERDTYPFCSMRCKQVDLGRWLTGSYVIPGRAEDEESTTQDDSDRQN